MLKRYPHFFKLLFQVTDAFVVFLCWIAAYYIRFFMNIPGINPAGDAVSLDQYLVLAFILVMIWFLSLHLYGSYKSWRLESFVKEFFNIVKASTLAFVTGVTLVHFFARDEISRATMGIFFILAILGLTFSRSLLRLILKFLRKRGFNQRYALIIGHGDLIQNVSERVHQRIETGLQIRGCIVVGDGETPASIPTLGSIDQLEAIIKDHDITHVIVSLKNTETYLLNPILDAMIETHVDVKVIPDITQYSILGFEVEEFDGLPVLSLNQSPVMGWNAVLKRISDIIYASVAILVFSPFLFLIATIIKLTSKGPILYSQERMGLDGVTFKMYKFRSMRTDAEVQTGAVWAKKDDDRVTWIGGILRKTSLDELPQFFNVLKGDMSCVGPRPERPVFVEKFRKEISGYMLRHKVKAGITGWAQINGLRGNTSLKDRIEYDLYYISHWSLWFDLRIMILTLFKGFISPNAY